MLGELAKWLIDIQYRYQLSKLTLKSRGVNVQISRGFEFSHSENIEIGNHVYIGPGSRINALGGVHIRSGTVIGPELTIYTADHRYEGSNAIPFDDIVLLRKVDIGENVWIGGNVIIVPGVQIGEGCVIGAGSVVTKSFPSFKVLGGNPAKELKERDKDQYLRLKREGRIYLLLKSSGKMHRGLDIYVRNKE